MQASSAFIGVLKWVAAQVIVAHHLAAYGPLAQQGHAAMPQLFGGLTGCGAWTVSVFLVVSGFLTAQALDGKNIDFLLVRHALIRRYWRLAPVYAVGLSLSVAMAVFFHPWVSPDMLPQQLDASILLGNFFFLQDILGLEVLSAGLWYMAIDLQLFALFICLASLSHGACWNGLRVPKEAIWAVVGMLSLSYFNLRSEWNVWAIYFAGTYALGALAYSAGDLSKHRWVVGGLYLGGALLCAWFEPRPRLFVAMVTAVVLFGIQFISMDASFWTRLARKMGDSSYALFLSHFSILMLMSCIYPAAEAWDIPFVGWLWATLLACNAVGWLIWRYIDVPLQRHRQM